ncbi:MAG TPA: YXWGXW repeat-containing protein [Candidatus Sulfotelmatobacter sp.]|nr:YXWGXW repeat-containing protein [Candidatus Sulfotelmatobacter sp.]
MKNTILVGLAVLLMSMASVGQVVISVGIAPPALPVYEQPICPGDGYIWTPGYWAWDGDDYYWVPGTWVMAPEVGYLWTPPWWGWGDGVYVFHPGWWGPQVGFYGGINYGFGYFGNGYEGGRWEGRRFFYNREVTNVNVVNIHNVYNERVVVNRTENRISYNGGRGGIEARPTGRDEAAARERHMGPSAQQMSHMETARSNRELRASVNHGRPAVMATDRPGQLRGGAEPARGGPEPARGGGGRYGHARDLPPIERPGAPNTGNAKQDQKYQKQQQKMYAQQQKDRQKLEQRQQREDQQMARRNNPQQRQQMEQRHQQQTQQMQERHANQTRAMSSRQQPGPRR